MAIPVLTANWDLDLDATNAARAGHPFTLRLNARTQPGADPVPVTGATVFVSYDDGGTWREIAMTGTGGQFTGTVHHPKMRDTTGFVSLKYQLTDASGGILEQTIYRAYALK